MNDQSSDNLDRLLRAARSEDPGASRLEFAFETRLMARLAEERSGSLFAFAWRLCPFFAAVAVAAVVWSRTGTARLEADGPLLAEASRTSEDQNLVAYFTGDPAR